MLPNQSAVLTSPDVSFTQQKSLLVRYHEATDGIVLAVCSNDLNTCQDVSNLDATKGDRNWRDGAATITTATKKVLRTIQNKSCIQAFHNLQILIIAKNVGPNVGAVGISSIGIGNSEPGSRNRC